MYIKKVWFFLFIFIIIFTSACTNNYIKDTKNESSYPISPSNVVNNDVDDSETGYPITSYPTPANDYNKLEIPSPNPDTGIIYGKLISLTTDENLSFSNVYLAEKIILDSNGEYILSYTGNSSPHTQTISSGDFLITEIPPSEYVLVLVTPIDTFPIVDEVGNQIELIISGGESINLSEIYSKWPDFQ